MNPKKKEPAPFTRCKLPGSIKHYGLAIYTAPLQPQLQLQSPPLRNLFVEDFNTYHAETITTNANTELVIM